MKTSVQAAAAAVNLYSEYFLGLIVSMTIARNLSTSDYGIYSSVIWLATLFTLAINSGVSLNVTKFVAEFGRRDKNLQPAILAYFWRIQYTRLLVVIVLAALAIYFEVLTTKIEKGMLVLLVIAVTIKADYMFRVAIYKGVKRFDIIAKTSLIANPFNIIAVLACAYFSPTVESFVIVFCSACLVYGISTRLFVKHMPHPVYNAEHIAPHKKRMLFQVISATVIVLLASLIFRQSQVFVLERNDFLSEAGFFNIAFLLSTAAITLVPGVYQEILLPKITEAVQDGNLESQVTQAQRFLLTLALLVVIPVVIYADVIINLLYGERYLDAVLPLQILIVFKALMTLNQGANLTLISNDKQVSMAKTHVLLFIVAAILSVILVPLYGLYASIAVYAVLVCLMLLVYGKLATKVGYCRLPMKEILTFVLAAILASIPAILTNQVLSGIPSAIIGSLLFAICYSQLLFLFKSYDKSVAHLLKTFERKASGLTKAYLGWCIKCLT